MNKKQKLEARIKDLQERISMNDQTIDEGIDDFKKYSRADNRFCKPLLKEMQRELDAISKSKEVIENGN